MVSVWLWLDGSQRDLTAYLDERYDDDDEPMSRFAADLRVVFYDHDVQECETYRSAKPIATLIDGSSWSASYLDAVVVAAAKRGIERARGHLLLFDRAWRGRWPASSPLTFVGSFPVEREENPEPERRPGDHQSSVSAVAIAPDGRLGITGDDSGEVALWDLTRGVCVARGDGRHPDGVAAAAFAADGRLVTTGTEIVVWRREGARLVGKKLGSSGGYRMPAVAVHRREPVAVAVSVDGAVTRWRLDGGRREVLARVDGRFDDVCLGDDGTVIARTDEGAVMAWRDGERRWGLDASDDWRSGTVIAGRCGVLARGRRAVAVDLATGAVVASTPAKVDRLAAAPGGAFVAIAAGRRVATWDLRGPAASVAAHRGDVADVAASSSLVMSVGEDGAARLWSVSLAPRGRFDASGPLTRCAGRRDGTRWLVGGEDGQVHVLAWSGRALRALR